jgi:PleD family two-component response regulator
MPGIDGFEVYRQLKKDSKTKDIPIIFVTIKDELEYLIEGFKLGAADFIIKPFTKYEILARVKPQTQLYRLKKILSRDVNACCQAKVHGDGKMITMTPGMHGAG